MADDGMVAGTTQRHFALEPAEPQSLGCGGAGISGTLLAC